MSLAKPLALAKLTIHAFGPGDFSWQRVHTKDEEFSILMPVRPPDFVREDQKLGVHGLSVSKERVVKGYQDGIVFIVKMYETSKPKELLNDYFDIFHYKKADTHEVRLGSFEGVQYIRKEEGLYHNIQCFAASHRVYVIELAGRSETIPAINQFLSSLKLGGATLGLNDASSATGNPSNPENTSQALTPITNPVFDKREVTRPAVSLYLPIPVRPNGFRGTIKLSMVLSASGEVTDISAAKGLSYSISQYFTDLAKHIIFLPAEKDGHPVSQYSEVTFNLL